MKINLEMNYNTVAVIFCNILGKLLDYKSPCKKLWTISLRKTLVHITVRPNQKVNLLNLNIKQ